MSQDFIAYLERQGYTHVRKLPSGEWAGLQQMMFTTGLFLGLSVDTWRTRFCYETTGAAIAALEAWDGQGFPPGFWVKQKPEETLNPLRSAT